jgi:hypothetical protein
MTTDELLGRTFQFYRVDRSFHIRTPIQVVAVDPEKGVRIWSKMHGAAWVPQPMFDELLANVLEAAV